MSSHEADPLVSPVSASATPASPVPAGSGSDGLYDTAALHRGLRDVVSMPSQVGAYHIIDQIGEGGMGEVYLAEDTGELKLTVAVKIIRRGLESDSSVRRFIVERETLATMDHPNIARVISGGRTDDGRLYVVMEFVPGDPITRFADEQRLTIRQRLNLFLQVCHAIDHAHKKAVIHRDIKPSNVLAYLDPQGNPLAKVIDFGIAKVLDHEDLTIDRTDQTLAGAPIGTPAYMSPEQTMGKAETRSDVYSLGALLYELLAGEQPLRRRLKAATSRDEEFRVIRDEDPSTPSTSVRTHSADAVASTRQEPDAETLAKLLKRELQWIPLKALKKDPKERYQTAASLAKDVERYLEGEALIAGPDTRRYRVRKFINKHRGATAATLTIVTLLVAGVAGTTYELLQAIRAKTAMIAALSEAARANAETSAAKYETDQSRRKVDSFAATNRKVIKAAQQMAGGSPELARSFVTSLKESWEKLATDFGKDDPSTIEAMCDYADALFNAGDAATAEGTAHDAMTLAMGQSSLGLANELTRRAGRIRVQALQALNRPDEAAQVLTMIGSGPATRPDTSLAIVPLVTGAAPGLSSTSRPAGGLTSTTRPAATRAATTLPIP